MYKANFCWRVFQYSLTGTIFYWLMACNSAPPLPKPKGYLRIDLPEAHYQLFDSAFPYRFEYSTYARIEQDQYTIEEPYWMNIYYPIFKARIHISHKDLTRFPLYLLTEDSHTFVYRHAEKATGISQQRILKPDRKLYGFTYHIQGKDVASPFQFWITDSTNHYVRGSLYFSVRPNNDSLKPVIDFIIRDIYYMIETWNWVK